MATGFKISQLTRVTTPSLSDLFETSQSDVSYSITLGQMTGSILDNIACRVATTGALTATYDNGTSGVSATLVNAGALAALTIDGISVAAGNRVLVKNQGSALQNGVYVVTAVGDASTAWRLTRSLDFDEPNEIVAGKLFTIGEGTTNGKTQWLVTTTGAVTIGVTNITFESNIVAGTGITKTNNTISTTLTLSGTYTPTLTNVANLDASTPYQCQYMRVGSVVTVSGLVDVDPTAGATPTELGISLPIASTLAAAQNCAGTAFASAIAGQGAAIMGDVANARAQMAWISGDTTNQPMYFNFSYLII